MLKTYGYSDALVAGLILVESALLCVASALIGIAGVVGVLVSLLTLNASVAESTRAIQEFSHHTCARNRASDSRFINEFVLSR